MIQKNFRKSMKSYYIKYTADQLTQQICVYFNTAVIKLNDQTYFLKQIFVIIKIKTFTILFFMKIFSLTYIQETSEGNVIQLPSSFQRMSRKTLTSIELKCIKYLILSLWTKFNSDTTNTKEFIKFVTLVETFHLINWLSQFSRQQHYH